jgi:hypothetical protein
MGVRVSIMGIPNLNKVKIIVKEADSCEKKALKIEILAEAMEGCRLQR